MKNRIFRLTLYLLCLLVVSLVYYIDDPGADVQAVVKTTVELSEYEASYQWVKLTGTLSSLRLVDAVGFRYHLAGGLIYEEKFFDCETLTNPFIAFFNLDLSGDKDTILLMILSLIAFTVVVIIILLIIGRIKKVW